ncbi:hypothetical protein [Cytobacillus kochii]|uniref:hypothetical protein n=1 Tax=Cytobacillus kochii TaxID=859143 RepID=UPI001CD5D0AD|nr:hypothetical protein [Cytobacillus kochii]MCA1028839.1 hypothetical protein [Cytobacillus kochii]
MEDNNETGVKGERNSKLKKIYLIAVVIFIGAIILYFLQQGKTDVENKNNDEEDSLIIDENNDKNENTEDTEEDSSVKISDKDLDTMKDTVFSFINGYYRYDYENVDQNLVDTKSALTEDFYKELKLSQSENTKVPVFAYREVKDIKLVSYEIVNNVPSFLAEVTAELLDENKEKLSTVKVEFYVDMVKVKNDWKISYLTMVGTSIEDNN